jgi:hypothetical protein
MQLDTPTVTGIYIVFIISIVGGCQTETCGYLNGATPAWVTETFVNSMMQQQYRTATMCVLPSERQAFRDSLAGAEEWYDAVYSLDSAVAANYRHRDVVKFRGTYLWELLATPLRGAIENNRVDWKRIQWKGTDDDCEVWVEGHSKPSLHLRNRSGNWYIDPHYDGTPLSSQPKATWAILREMSKLLRNEAASVRSGNLSPAELFEELSSS